MLNKKVKQVVTGLLAGVLVLSMLAGVVIPVFAVEDREGIFTSDHLLYTDYLYNYTFALHEDFNEFISGDSKYLSVLSLTDESTGRYKFVVGNDELGYAPFYQFDTEVEESGDSTSYIAVNLDDFSGNFEKSLDSAIKGADCVSEVDISGHCELNFLTNPKGLSNLEEYKKFLDSYSMYVIDASSDSVKYEIPLNNLMDFMVDSNGSYITASSGKTYNTGVVDETSVESESTESSTEVSIESNTEISTEEPESESSSEEVISDSTRNQQEKLPDNTVYVKVLDESNEEYKLDIAIVNKGEDVEFASMYLANANETFKTMMFEFDNVFTVNRQEIETSGYHITLIDKDGNRYISNSFDLEKVDIRDLNNNQGISNEEVELVEGDFKVEFSGLPESAFKGDSVTFKMTTEVPCKMKFNNVSIGKNTLGTSFDVTVSDNGEYAYEAVSEDGKVVTGKYNVTIFTEKEENSSNLCLLVIIAIVVLGVGSVVVIVMIKKSKASKNVVEEIKEEDL